MDVLALNISAIAREHNGPTEENPPHARALDEAIEIDQEVPAEHCKAVTEAFGYLMRLAAERQAN